MSDQVSPIELNRSENGEGEVSFEIHGAVAVVRLGLPSEKVVLLTDLRMESLAAALRKVQEDPNLKGLVITGPSARHFSAGADIKIIDRIIDSQTGHRLARSGQKIFEMLDKLPLVTVAAIGGVCVGGALELALSCDYRIVATNPETRLGLPEIRLGIIPGFGGTQRLPRLVGIRRALEMILKGKLLDSAAAISAGLADLAVDPGKLEEEAREVILGRRPIARRQLSKVDRFLTFTALGRSLVSKKAKQEIERETRGQFSAPGRALEVVCHGLSRGFDAGFHEEARALGELAASPQCKALVHLFFRTEDASRLGKAVRIELNDAEIGVVGAGTMGAGIAAILAAAGARVVVVDPLERSQRSAKERVRSSVERRKGSISSEELNQRLVVTDEREKLSKADFIIEAVIEELQEKQELFEDLSRIVEPATILASNTSSLRISEIGAQLDDPSRLIGMHFFNPPEKMPLVEIVRGKSSSEKTILHASSLAVALGKYPIVVEDVPGFLVNRVLFPYLAEAAELLREGMSVEEVDRAAEDFGMRMGPFAVLDEVGLDVASKVAAVLAHGYPDRMSVPEILTKMVERGFLGRKSGAGFYRYSEGRRSSHRGLAGQLGIEKLKSSFETGALDRLSLSLLNEAVRALDEGVAGTPGPEAAGQIDLATVMGFGFPAFRGGVIKYAQSLGAKGVEERLSGLARRCGDRFRPWNGISERARQKLSFYQYPEQAQSAAG